MFNFSNSLKAELLKATQRCCVKNPEYKIMPPQKDGKEVEGHTRTIDGMWQQTKVEPGFKGAGTGFIWNSLTIKSSKKSFDIVMGQTIYTYGADKEITVRINDSKDTLELYHFTSQNMARVNPLTVEQFEKDLCSFTETEKTAAETISEIKKKIDAILR
jgi:ABC-type tungstate transport system permease subunit